MQSLKQIDLFSNFSDDELKSLSSISKIESYTKDSIIFFEGDVANNLLIIISGKVAVYKTKENANETILNTFYTGELFAEAPCIYDFAYPASAKCLDDTQILYINFEKFKTIFLSDAKISLQIILALSQKIKKLSRFIEDGNKTAAQKLTEYLQNNNLDDIKHKDLAAKLNIRAETLSRLIAKLTLRNKGVRSR